TECQVRETSRERGGAQDSSECAPTDLIGGHAGRWLFVLPALGHRLPSLQWKRTSGRRAGTWLERCTFATLDFVRMRIVRVDPRHPDISAIEDAAAILRAGGLVAFPTETVYGLGADALSAAAVQRIYRAKGRPSYNPIIVHVTDAAAVRRVAAEWPSSAD